jgi:glycosyltransferase involved in cell wall biosynthesis
VDAVEGLMDIFEAVFWVSVIGVFYPYFGYPMVLHALGVFTKPRERRSAGGVLPSVSLLLPVHNEACRLERKLANTQALRYPPDKLQVIVVSDGSTDRTSDIVRAAGAAVTLIELPVRRGKAAALNAGLARATNEIVVFSDASIELAPEALEQLVAGFVDPRVGCISGEDRIPESGGEALYGRYEVMLRRLETRVHSIAGASGSFYAQRRTLCAEPFVEGLAPDFLSVLRTVEQGYRAISEPAAIGLMASVKDPRREFERKVRTLIRGMTTIFANAALLNPFRYGWFSFVLLSHKLMRWLAPLFLLLAFLSSAALVRDPLYAAAFVAQALFYFGGFATLRQWGSIHKGLPGRAALYFSSVNVAITVAWVRYVRGIRLEVWTPSQR